jgi:rhodanese-related sulfurtransferase
MKMQYLLSLLLMAALSSAAAAHTDITVHDANNMLTADPNLLVIDVREASEYCGSGGHLPGAYNYPYNSDYLEDHYTDFDPAEKILVICRSGSRSNAASNFLDSKGFTQVYDIQGGTITWDDYYPTVGCVDTDKDGFNDDLDNLPGVFNPTQSDSIWLADFSEMAARWQMPAAGGLFLEDLVVFCEYWLEALP